MSAADQHADELTAAFMAGCARGREGRQGEIDALNADLLGALKLLVDWYGKRGGDGSRADDELLPASEQTDEIAKAMEVIARAERRI